MGDTVTSHMRSATCIVMRAVFPCRPLLLPPVIFFPSCPVNGTISGYVSKKLLKKRVTEYAVMQNAFIITSCTLYHACIASESSDPDGPVVVSPVHLRKSVHNSATSRSAEKSNALLVFALARVGCAGGGTNNCGRFGAAGTRGMRT